MDHTSEIKRLIEAYHEMMTKATEPLQQEYVRAVQRERFDTANDIARTMRETREPFLREIGKLTALLPMPPFVVSAEEFAKLKAPRP